MKVRIIILASVLLAAAIGVHIAVYAPLAKDYSEVLSKIDKTLPEYRKIITEYDPDGIGSEVRKMKESVVEQMDEYNRLRSRYKLDQEVYQVTNRIQHVLDLVNEIRQIEDESQNIGTSGGAKPSKVKVNVTGGWGLGSDFVPGKFGRGLFATSDHYAVMPGEVRTFNKQEGTIEMWVKPDWNPNEETVHYFMMAYGVLESGGPAAQTDISLYKNEKGSLVYTVKEARGSSQRLMEPINHWKKGEWHHLAITWSKKNPKNVALYVDGRKASGMQGRSGGNVGAGMGMPGMGMPGMGMPGMMPGMGMPGMGMMGANNRRNTRQQTGVAPEVIDEIVVGADRYYLKPADAVIDEFRISSVARSQFDINRRPTRDEYTMVLDRMEDHLFDPSLLSYLVQEMESKLRIIHDGSSSKNLKREKQVQFDALRKTLAMDEGKLGSYDPTSAWIQRIYYCNQIAERLEGYDRERIRIILGFKWPKRRELDSLISFLELVREVLNKAIEQEIDEINKLEILGEANYLDESELKDFFEEEIKLVAKEAGVFYMPEGEMMPGMGMPGLGMPGMMPGMGMPGMGMPGMGMPGMGMPGMGMPGMGMPGMGMPGMGMPGMGMAGISSVTNPNDPYAMQDFMEMQKNMERAQKKFDSYIDSKNKGIIPKPVRDAFQQNIADKKINFYKRRSLRIEVKCPVDKLAEFLYRIEFGDRVSTINTMSIFADEHKNAKPGEEMLRANISYDVHTMVEPPEFEDDRDQQQVAEGGAPNRS